MIINIKIYKNNFHLEKLLFHDTLVISLLFNIDLMLNILIKY